MDTPAALLQSLESCPADEVSRYVWPRQHAEALTEDFHDFLYRQASDAKHIGASQRSDLLFDWYEELKTYVATWELVRQPNQEARIQYAEDNLSWLLTEQASVLLHEWECQHDEHDYTPRRLLIWEALQIWLKAKPDTQLAVFQTLRPFLLDTLLESLLNEVRSRLKLTEELVRLYQFRNALPKLRETYKNELIYILKEVSNTNLVRQCELLRLHLRLPLGNTAFIWACLGSGLSSFWETSFISAALLKEIISCYSQAIRKYSISSPGRADALYNRGNAYQKWPASNEAEHHQYLTLAIADYSGAHDLYCVHNQPINQAWTLHHRGNAYQKWPASNEAERRQYLTLAITDISAAHDLYRVHYQPEDQARAFNNRGFVYQELPTSNEAERRQYLTLAIADFSAACDLYRIHNQPRDQAENLYNRGNAYQKWPASNEAERRQYLTLAIADFSAACDLYRIHNQPRDQARALNNRGNAYQNWPASNKAERRQYLTLAIADLSAAHDFYSIYNQPKDHADTLYSRGIVCKNWPSSNEAERRQYLASAIADFGTAYDLYRVSNQTVKQADVLYSLGVLYASLDEDESNINYEKNQHKAIEDYLKPAKELYTRLRQLADIAKTLHTLGICHHNTWTHNHYQEAVGYYTQALAIRTPQYLPTECCETASYLGKLYLQAGDYKNALVALKRAEQAVDQLWRDAQSKGAKRELAARYADLYALLVATYLHEGKPAEAFRYAAAAKGRLLADAFNGQHPDRQQLLARDPQFAQRLQPLLALEQAAAEARSQLLRNPQLNLPNVDEESRATDLPEHVALRQQLATLYSKQDQLSENLARDFPALFATQAAPVLEAAEALARARQTQATLVEYYRHAQGWVAFIVRPDATEICVVRLGLTPAPGAPKPTVLDTDELLTEQMGQWSANINRFARWPRIEHRSRDAALHRFAQVFVHPLLHLLPKGGRLVLAPNQALHGLPLQAVPMPDLADGYLADHFELSFMPSLAALAVRLRQQEVSGRPAPAVSFTHPRLLALSCPLPKADPRHLAQVVPEAQAILQLFEAAQHPTTWLQEADGTATVEHVIDACRTAPPTVFYVGCHGGFSAVNPAHSGLRLQDGQWLDASRILNELPLRGVALTVLAACQSGRVQVETGDELVGLPQALLTVGTDMVLASQWAVTDEATRHLMEAFFAALFQPAGSAPTPTPAQALQQAMRSVRTARDERGQLKWAHPYYWAAFRLLSVPHPRS